MADAKHDLPLSEEVVREHFRAYDGSGWAKEATPWQIWRDAYKRCQQALATASEDDRRDAERYRKIRAMHWSQGDDTLVVVRSKSLRLGTRTFSDYLLDEAIDAALHSNTARAEDDRPGSAEDGVRNG